MAIDLRRCAEAAAHAALAEAFAPPEPKRRPRSRRRLQPVRTVLAGIGLVTTVRVALSPALRRSIIEAVAEHLPLEELLDKTVLDADVVPESDDAEPQAGETEEDGTDAESGEDAEFEEPAKERGPAHAGAGQRRRSASRARGDANGRGGRKPPNRGTRA